MADTDDTVLSILEQAQGEEIEIPEGFEHPDILSNLEIEENPHLQEIFDKQITEADNANNIGITR